MIVCKILQAASAVHLTVVLCDLAYVSSKQAMLHCCELSTIKPSVPQADRTRLRGSNQGGRLSKLGQVLQKYFLKDAIGCLFCDLSSCVDALQVSIIIINIKLILHFKKTLPVLQDTII